MVNSRRPWRLGIVGCGRMGRWHTEKLHADGRGRVVAVCDDPEHRRAADSLRDALAPEAAAFDGLADMLDGCDLDAAVICTPTSLHFDQVLACWSKGLPVLCEKPLAARREEIAELSDRAPMSPLLSIAYQRRSWSVYRTLRREVRSGRWGRVTAVTSVNAEAWQPTIAGTWRDDLEVNPGGFIGDAGSHKIDAIFYTTGLRAVNVDAASWRCGSRVDIVTNVLAVLEGDVPLTMTFAGNAHAFQEDLHIHCERADLLLRNGVLTVAHEGRIQPIEPLEPQAEAVSAFLDLLDGVSENHAPADCALPVHDFTRAVLQSAELRQPIALR